jgi:hypothetical protein
MYWKPLVAQFLGMGSFVAAPILAILFKHGPAVVPGLDLLVFLSAGVAMTLIRCRKCREPYFLSRSGGWYPIAFRCRNCGAQ